MNSRIILPIMSILIVLLAVVAILSTTFGSIKAVALHYSKEEDYDYGKIIDVINYSQVYEHIKFFCSLNSRVTGYPGSFKAANYIADVFKDAGLEVIRQKYTIPVPLDEGSYIIANGSKISAYAVWPNYVQTCYTPPLMKVEGPLVYGGYGTLSELNGRNIKGSIVILEFNSKSNWINVAKLGAKAVIFIEPHHTTLWEARSKFIMVPMHFPRLYIRAEEAGILRKLAEEGATARVVVNMQYQMIKAENIIGVIEGTELPDEIVVIAAHYDTWSVIPRLAPGADEASAVSILLELAKYFSNNRPKRTIWLVALSGHWEGLAGARVFVEKFFFDKDVLSGRKKIIAFIGLDFSTDSNRVALLYAGHFYAYTGSSSSPIYTRWTRWLAPRIFMKIIPKLQEVTGRNYVVDDGFRGEYGWWASIYGAYMLDSEPFAVAHGLGFTIRTASSRSHWGHPLSDLSEVNMENLVPQVEIALSIIYDLVNNGVAMSWDMIRPARVLFVAGGADVAGYITLYGQVLCYNISKGWYDPVSRSLVAIIRGGHDFSNYPFYIILNMSDSNGQFIVHGIGGLFAVHASMSAAPLYIEAFKINEKTGMISYAPDYGQHGAMQFNNFIYYPDRHPYNVTTVVFKCSSIVIFDVIDVLQLKPKVFLDPRFEDREVTPWSSTLWTFQVLDFETKSEYVMWGYFARQNDDIAMAFVPPNTRAMIMYKLTPAYRIIGVLVNASDENPEGNGFFVGENEELKVYLSALCFAKDVFYITKHRYTQLQRGYVRSPIAESSLLEAEIYLKRALKALREFKYDKAYAFSKAAWTWALHAYEDVMHNICDASNVAMVFFALLIPFAFFGERLLLHCSGTRRFISMPVLFALALMTFYLIHPASKLMAIFLMSPLSVTLEALFIFVLCIFISRGTEIIKEVRLKMVGRHFAERSTISLLGMLFSTAVENMRRRRLRTSLVLLTIISVAFSLVALSSVIPVLTTSYISPINYNPSYEGIYLTPPVIEVAPSNIIDYNQLDFLLAIAETKAGSLVKLCPRVWWYPASIMGREVTTYITSSVGRVRVKAALGLAPDEPLVRRALKIGRWFITEDKYKAILTDKVASILNVTIGDKIKLGSYELTIVGIIDSKTANLLTDLNALPITPIDPDRVASLLLGALQEEQQWTFLSYDEVIIVPYELALEMGGYVANVALLTSNVDALTKIADALAIATEGLFIFVCQDNNVIQVVPFVAFQLYGWNTLIIPLIIGALTIASAILGAVKERAREIDIYSALGLSPKGIALIFLIESLTYALIGVPLGYLVGVFANILLISSGMLPPQFIINASSLFAVVAVLLVMVFTILPSIYPAFMATRHVVPSLERRWRIPTKPAGDVWEIPLPFTTKSEEETKGLLNFLWEYFEAHRVETPEPFIVRDSSIVIESSQSMKIKLVVSLLPLEAGVTQETIINAQWSLTQSRYLLSIYIKKLSGSREIWLSGNYSFVDCIRKQFLIWKSLSEEERKEYSRREVNI